MVECHEEDIKQKNLKVLYQTIFYSFAVAAVTAMAALRQRLQEDARELWKAKRRRILIVIFPKSALWSDYEFMNVRFLEWINCKKILSVCVISNKKAEKLCKYLKEWKTRREKKFSIFI